MAFTVRRFIIYVKRNVFMLVLFIICFALVVSFLLYKWTELDARLDCLKKHYTDFHFTTITQAALVRSDVPEARENIRPQSSKSDDLISQHVANRTELRLKWLRQKVERISRKVKAQSVTLTQHHSSGLADNGPNYNIHIFYYAWYGNVAVEGHWKHWNHNYLPNWKKEDKKVYPTGSHEPPSDIGSNFYPALGCYSSRDPLIINTHMKQLRDAKVGVVVVSWYPPGHDDSPEPMMTLLLDTAQRYDLKVAPHIEPYRNRNPINFSEHLRYLINQYGSHPALYRMQKRGQDLPVFYVYDSYLTPASAWKELLSAKGNLSVRGTQLDGIFLGLLVEMQHRYDIKKAHFDGFYTYFATNGFTYGSSWKNWHSLSKFARQNGLVFVPSVGPGYIDTQVRPWNVANTRHRRHGKYYEVGWRSAMSAQARIVAITSFNEWHEGTQIEPAIARSTPSFTYLDYEPEGSHFYLNLTHWWINEFDEKQD